MLLPTLLGRKSLFPRALVARTALFCGRVVCRPFDKFFNSKEAEHKLEPLDWATARAYEKVDGSLIKCYFYQVTSVLDPKIIH